MGGGAAQLDRAVQRRNDLALAVLDRRQGGILAGWSALAGASAGGHPSHHEAPPEIPSTHLGPDLGRHSCCRTC